MSQVPPPQERPQPSPTASRPPAPPVQPVPSVPPPPPMGDATGGLIPYKNVPAMVGYYLGVFSLIPCIGIPLGIAAVVLGIFGLRKAARQPEVRGKVHAWVAIMLGGLTAIGYTALAVVFAHVARG